MKLSSKQQQVQIGYWSVNAKNKFETMESLYRNRRYADCLFFGHLVLEMTLKALVTRITADYAPKIHNLSRLAELARLELGENEVNLLAQVSHFNMKTRYPDERLDFYKKCDKIFTDRYYSKIKRLYKKLCQLTK